MWGIPKISLFALKILISKIYDAKCWKLSENFQKSTLGGGIVFKNLKFY